MGKYITIEDDQTKVNQSLKNLKKLYGSRLIIGVIGDGNKGNSDEISLPELAAVHEFGVSIEVTDAMRGWFWYQGYHVAKDTIEIPERSFIRRAFDENKAEIRRKTKRLITPVIEGKITAEMFMDKLGTLLVGIVQKTIAEVEKPPLSGMTKERRSGKSGGESPLQDTGRLWGSIDYEVKW